MENKKTANSVGQSTQAIIPYGIDTNSIKNAKLKKELENIIKGLSGMNKNQWTITDSFYNIVKTECFKDDFATMENFSEHIGTPRTTIIQYVKASEFDKKYKLNHQMTSSNCYELSTIKDLEKFLVFCSENGITQQDLFTISLAKLKELKRVFAQLGKPAEQKALETETETEETETEENTIYIMVADEKGNKYNVPENVLAKYIVK